ncbi:biofilm PGA synthesis protein PgaA [Pseudoxanthomonas sp. GM95]|uniref:poly-beta-1,6 N-acetyl-D-glucosamine export porin PgaA n=1 Tax=Pseudoxanthomonas sp. GM95 TaxID=1881043 RepID=UPI0008B5F882|nr:poly-beta-1,6 N-acetyl-D-glucosamine export porin PgaA [Pseudoxanthomonas sp. GM95]SEL90692.1 biofilm PGA synthesis protein PgaA [Pseudoxanthomonas sp. GM95]
MRPLNLLLPLALMGFIAQAQAETTQPDDPFFPIEELRKAQRFPDALQAIQTLLAQDPGNRRALRLQVLTLDDMGASQQAWQLMQAHPEDFATYEREKVEDDRIAHRIRWGTAYAADEVDREKETRNALALLRQLQDQHPRQTTWEATRLRVDALSSLNQLQRHQEVIDGYDALKRDQIDVPAYILPTVADSMMALRRPEDASAVLLTYLKTSPGDVNARILLSYAWIEQERFDRALPLLEQLSREQPAWPRREGALRGYENWDKYSADMTLAMARSFAQDNASAERALRALIAIGPTDSALQAALGAVEARRQRPSAALERYAMALTLDPRQRDARFGQVDALTALNRPDQATAVLSDLRTRYPEDLRGPRAQRALDLKRGWQFRVEAGRGRSDAREGGTSNSPLGSRDGSLLLEADSPLMDDRWRAALLARDDWASLSGEHVRYRGVGAGIRYRYDRLGVSVDALQAIDRYDRGATTVAVKADWRFSDAWTGTVAATTNDPEASLQARRLGITANSVGVGATYAPSDTTEIATKLSHFRYDDGNRRDQLGIDARQRLSSQPHLLVDGLASVYTSRGSDGADAAYFNPSRDASAAFGVRLDHIGWRRYEREFRQILDVTVGPYWQEGYGTSIVPAISYRHRWAPAESNRLEYGVSWSRPVYDGRRENRVSLDVIWRWGTAE